MGSQVINMPVRSRGYLAMVRDAAPHTSRPQGAAHVNVETATKVQGAEFPDSDQSFLGTEKD
jgi:hypothetical protein